MTATLPSMMAIGIVLVDYVIKVSGNYSNRSPQGKSSQCQILVVIGTVEVKT